MSLLTHADARPSVTSQMSPRMRRIVARIPGWARARLGAMKLYSQAAASILFFSALWVVLLGTKAAIMFSRMQY